MIKDQLMKIKVQRPRLSKEIDNCLLQLNKMDQRQERLKEIIKLNSADYMDDSIGLLDEAEQFICKNMIRVINLSLASEDEPLDDPTYKKQVQSVLEANDKVLETCKNLLIDVANYISDKSQGQPINLTRLESWRQTVHDSITFTEK
ncbi:MAG: hypothetical protein FWC47_14990 [Oscillospiraceae bacterium]|nr:hypothetical protein [Oscillospiraceae bacterium]